MIQLLSDLTKAKVVFQQRAIMAAMDINQSNSTGLEYCNHCQEWHEDGETFCSICGDHHESDSVPYTCQTGDGV